MIIKPADSRDDDLSTLRALLQHPTLSPAHRTAIDRELRTLRAGVQGEQEAAYELDFHYGRTSTNYAVLHDLRIEHEGRVAQMDHLVIGRCLDVWVCESKSFAEGLAVNEHGEWVGFRQSVPFGIASPIEQNRKHTMVLDSLFKSPRFSLPTRLGFALKPTLHSVVLVANKGRIGRPRAPANVPGLEALMKVDQFFQHQQAAVDTAPALSVAKVVGRDTLREFAEQLKRFHRPHRTDWAARFGVPGASRAPAGPTPGTPGYNGWEPLVPRGMTPPPPRPMVDASRPSPAHGASLNDWMRRSDPTSAPAASASGTTCEGCGEPVGADVVRFCRFNKIRFQNRLLCRTCQRA